MKYCTAAIMSNYDSYHCVIGLIDFLNCTVYFPVGSPLGSGGRAKSSAGSPLGAQKRDVSFVHCE